MILLASARRSPADFLATVEGILRDNVFRLDDPANFSSGFLLWVTESTDELHVPLIVDLPVPIEPNRPPADPT